MGLRGSKLYRSVFVMFAMSLYALLSFEAVDYAYMLSITTGWIKASWHPIDTAADQKSMLLHQRFALTHCILRRLSQPGAIYWKSPISILGTTGYEIYIFLEKNGKTIWKQWRPWSGAAFCGVWSGSALFAKYPFTISRLQWVNLFCHACIPISESQRLNRLVGLLTMFG